MQLLPNWLVARPCSYPSSWPVMLVSTVLYLMLVVAANSQLPIWFVDLQHHSESICFQFIRKINDRDRCDRFWRFPFQCGYLRHCHFPFLCRHHDLFHLLMFHCVHCLDFRILRFVPLYSVDCDYHIGYSGANAISIDQSINHKTVSKRNCVQFVYEERHKWIETNNQLTWIGVMRGHFARCRLPLGRLMMHCSMV